MKINAISRYRWLLIFLLFFMQAFPACSQRAMEGAGRGAVTGAAVGAVGGMVSALVFGGDVGDAAARGAVWGGSTGAASGAISGAVADSNQKKAQQATELEALRKKLGDDTFQGLVALAECKHEVALGYGRTAAASDNPDYALAGLWLQTLAYADSGQIDQARTMFSQLMAKDDSITAESQAERKLQAAHKQLIEIRYDHATHGRKIHRAETNPLQTGPVCSTAVHRKPSEDGAWAKEPRARTAGE